MISWYLFVSQKIKLVGAFKYFSCSPLFGKDSQFDGAHIFQRGWFKTTNKTNTRPFSTIDYLRVLIIEIGSTIILMVVEAQGIASIFSFGCLFRGFQIPRETSPGFCGEGRHEICGVGGWNGWHLWVNLKVKTSWKKTVINGGITGVNLYKWPYKWMVWQHVFFVFTPKLGEDLIPHVWRAYFQRGWFNHQLVFNGFHWGYWKPLKVKLLAPTYNCYTTENEFRPVHLKITPEKRGKGTTSILYKPPTSEGS